MNKQFLEGYSGQTVQQLIAMKDNYRVGSLLLAIEAALARKSEGDLSEPERVILAVEAMEREVNNGGYDQFFTNSSRQFTAFLVRALELIGCPKCAVISADAISVLDLPEHFDSDTVAAVAIDLSDEKIKKLDECDSLYYANEESIEQQLFAFIEQHQHEVRIPPMAAR